MNIVLERLQKLLEDRKGQVDVEITSSNWGDWYISIGVEEGPIDGYLSYGNFYSNVINGLEDCLDVIDRKKPGAKSILEKTHIKRVK